VNEKRKNVLYLILKKYTRNSESFIGDEGSKQGTAVNGMQVMYAKPKHGDIVNIGASQNTQASIMAIEEETITDFL
jgi:pSer/pThr/pTyr-binding forkhead associated (FHA) protein